MKTYRVRYERDETGWWCATVPSVKGCLTQGRSIHEARERIREALSLFVSAREANTARLVDDVVLPAGTKLLLARQQKVRRKLAQEQERARAAMAETVEALTFLGLSNRDAGELLGLSNQRVQQLRSKAG